MRQRGLPDVKNTPPTPKMKQPLPDNHIRVELDFIPVSERLPEYGKEVYLRKFAQGHSVIRIGYFDADELEESAWWMSDQGEYLEIAEFTHWAEIPTVDVR